MPSSSSYLALAAALSTANAAFQGFNYGSTFTDGSFKSEADFTSEFKTAAGLEGTDGAFTSARLYTMIQGGTTNDPISAIPAAISTKTSLLFGLWASAGDDIFNNELAALQKTIDQYCDQLDGLVAGISVGSEDLYRISPTGIKNDGLPGASPDTLAKYIKEVRSTIKGTCLSDISIGHVDTWTSYANSSNKALIDACDWLGMDTYPYFENTKANGIAKGADLFQAAIDETKAAAGGREIWITETGWPVSGKTENEAIPSLKNARTYWEDVGCPLFGVTNVWWYTLQDSAPTTPNPSFGVIGSDLTTTPLYDLSCKDVAKSSSSVSASATASATGSSSGAVVKPTKSGDAESTATGGAGSGSGSDSGSGSGSSSALPTHIVSPIPSGNVSVPTSIYQNGTGIATATGGSSATATNGGGSSDSGSTDGSGSTPTTAPDAGSASLNSFAAAAVAVVLAVAML